VVAAALAGARAAPLAAHDGRPPAPHDLWTSWSADPGVVAALLLAGWLYARGARRVPRGAGAAERRQLRSAAFAAGWVAAAVALLSPLDALGSALFTAHMAQHVLLMQVAAPLLVLGAPLAPMLRALPRPWRRAAGRWTRARPVRGAAGWLGRPVNAWVLHAAAIWAWHLPFLYDAGVRSDAVHAAQHATFAGSALAFWWAAARPDARGRAGRGVAVLGVFATAMHTAILGALLAFSPTLWYEAHAATTRAWGLTPLEDQQLAGLVMWVPAGFVYVAAGLGLLHAWLRAAERAAPAARSAGGGARSGLSADRGADGAQLGHSQPNTPAVSRP
jgi:putative membrane protein